MKIFAIPGFLGLPSDWDFLGWSQLVALDWRGFSIKSPKQWGADCNRWIESQKNKEKKILMGYSLGGRLALHALIENTSLYEGAILISIHTGIADLEERSKRLENDRKWAERFKLENWSSLMDTWNGQSVFLSDSFYFDRKEEDYERKELGEALVQLSTGLQEDLLSQLNALPIPILFITGALDKKYCALAERVSLTHPLSQVVEIPGASHRVPWVQPKTFTKVVDDFLESLD